MKDDETIKGKNESTELTGEDFTEFLTATGAARWRILLAHAERNKKNIQIRRLKTMKQYNDDRYEEVSEQFEEFCRTKGIAAKFKLAFSDMAEGARKQHEKDKAQFEEVKRKSAEDNPEFTEFLHTKGFRAKVKLIIENIKRGAKESGEKTRKQIEQAKRGAHTHTGEYTADELALEFNEFLKAKGLDKRFVVEVTDED